MKSSLLVLLGLICSLAFAQLDQARVKIDSNFRSTKHILFAVTIPGSSHVTWVMRFLDELTKRGHKVTFATVDENVKYSAPYPLITTASFGPANFNHTALFTETNSHPSPFTLFPTIHEFLLPTWPRSYNLIIEQIEKYNVDVLICDFFTDACIEASHTKKLPLIVTATGTLTPDSATEYFNQDIYTSEEPTTVNQSVFRRFYNKFIAPLKVIWTVKRQMYTLLQYKRKAGILDAKWIDNPYDKTAHALKIIGNMFGLEVARPLGPLVELVGPVLDRSYPGLDSDLVSYLSLRQKVVYVAFGQHSRAIISDVERVLTPLIHQLEKGHIDGIIWSSGCLEANRFPATITSSYSGKTYNTTSLLNTNKKRYFRRSGDLLDEIYTTKWSPQMAILLHPSVQVFVSHGGANSIFECLYAGKRLLFYPFFADQPGASKQLSQMGVSEYFDNHSDLTDIDDKVEKVILDRDGFYQSNIKRYQAIIQIQSKGAPSRAADLVEEVAFSHDGQILPHREDVGNSMSFIKRYNLDVYLIAILLIGSFVTFVSFRLARLIKFFYHGYQIKQKSKFL
ncbi:uncharacterized protein BX664DRAFT_68397 [Halteromyces radiatus]|uniref:uncharacterized protein n=1 Tax=Halteromyces radiatus TaxID=101107 RepID=UPI00221FB98C|nr:uncharacterized protein BX664DRAFT_68397 [Halteromyces radiatus]KAI8096885.1 hypothetical protein BX664DRAFT_68397 [Halteromyces radiatus]